MPWPENTPFGGNLGDIGSEPFHALISASHWSLSCVPTVSRNSTASWLHTSTGHQVGFHLGWGVYSCLHSHLSVREQIHLPEDSILSDTKSFPCTAVPLPLVSWVVDFCSYHCVLWLPLSMNMIYVVSSQAVRGKLDDEAHFEMKLRQPCGRSNVHVSTNAMTCWHSIPLVLHSTPFLSSYQQQ